MSPKESRLLIAWDIDDVLNSLTLNWASWHGLDLNSVQPPSGDSATWVCSFGMEHSDYLASLDVYRTESYRSLEPNQLVLDLLQNWSCPQDTHIALTATPLGAQPIVAEWTMRHFGRWLRAVWFCPSQRSTDPPDFPTISKGDVLSRFDGRALLIDDCVTNLKSVTPPNQTVLYPRPWNSSQSDGLLVGFQNELLRTRKVNGWGESCDNSR